MKGHLDFVFASVAVIRYLSDHLSTGKFIIFATCQFVIYLPDSQQYIHTLCICISNCHIDRILSGFLIVLFRKVINQRECD